ncbi:hypothetical protein HT105_24770, partial [Bacteroides fragilis]|nr:hypothetical protein [Bacteroides fragilis]
LAIERQENPELKPTIVVAPTSVVGNWAREAAKFVPSLKVLVQHGSDRLKDEELMLAIERQENPELKPTIVVAPTSVVGNWAREAAK